MNDIELFIERSKHFERVERRHGYVKTAKYGLFMLDIDFFKRINDTFGHHSGDLVLKQFSGILRNSVRRTDDVLRFGGEEFLLVVKLTSDDFLLQFMKKLGSEIEAYDFRIEGDSVIGCTVSMGMVMIPNSLTGDVGELLKLADRAMYMAKDKGRNRGYLALPKNGQIQFEEVVWDRQ